MSNDQEQNPREQYTHGYGVASRYFSERSASKFAAFLLPHLKPCMTLLDCGCGPGSITLGLAEAVFPGEATGIDMSESQVESARTTASENNVSNVRFQQGNAYDIPFPDDSFDAVFSNALMEHISDPLKAIEEMRRVLKPGGVCGVRTPDRGGVVVWPETEELNKIMDLWHRVWLHNGGNPFVGRRLRSMFMKAGFTGVIASSSTDYYATAEVTQHRGSGYSTYTLENLGPQLVELGWATQEEVERGADAWEEWGNTPDAFSSSLWCEAIGWK